MGWGGSYLVEFASDQSIKRLHGQLDSVDGRGPLEEDIKIELGGIRQHKDLPLGLHNLLCTLASEAHGVIVVASEKRGQRGGDCSSLGYLLEFQGERVALHDCLVE